MAIEIKGLTKIYSKKVAGVRDLDLVIGDGGMFGLLGRNGAGKTTLLRILTTLLRPTAGEVKINGLDITSHKKKVRRMIGYLPQNFGVFPELSAYEFLDYMGYLYEMKDDRERCSAVNRVLEMVHLKEVKDRKLKTYSGGMVQRVGIAQALLNSPDILLVDEPTANLDPEERVKFRNLLSESSNGRVVVISTHIVNDISSTCADMAVLDEGRLQYRGSPSKLIGEAKGKVFEVRVNEEKLNEFRKYHRIISTLREQDEIRVRVLSEERIPEAEAVNPTLEDAYIYRMEDFRKDEF